MLVRKPGASEELETLVRVNSNTVSKARPMLRDNRTFACAQGF